MLLQHDIAFRLIPKDAHDKMFVAGGRVVFAQLLRGQVPMRVQPVRITRDEEEPLRAVRFRKFGRLRGEHGRLGAANLITLTRPAGSRRCRRIAFEQDGRHGDFLRGVFWCSGRRGFFLRLVEWGRRGRGRFGQCGFNRCRRVRRFLFRGNLLRWLCGLGARRFAFEQCRQFFFYAFERTFGRCFGLFGLFWFHTVDLE